jgi:phospholipid-transporting ATPase
MRVADEQIWVLTGDRQETAINIGLSCRLISESMNLVIINTESQAETTDLLNKRLFAIKNQRAGGDLEELALIIDGKSLSYALEDECKGILLELAIMCKAVVCCEYKLRGSEGTEVGLTGQVVCPLFRKHSL